MCAGPARAPAGRPAPGCSSERNGACSIAIGSRPGCSNVRRKSRACSCGSSSYSAARCMKPAGTPAACSVAVTSRGARSRVQRRQVLVDLGAPREATGRRGEVLALRPVGIADCAAQAAPVVVVADGHHAPLVVAGAGVDAPRGGVTAGVSGGPDRAGPQRLLDQQRADLHQDGLGLRGRDLGAAPRSPAADERRQRRDRRDAGGVVVGMDRRAVAEAAVVVGIAPQARQPRDASHQRPVAHPRAPRAGRADRAAVDHDDPRVDLPQRLRAEPELVQRARLEVRQHDVGARDQALDDVDPFSGAQVHAQALLPRWPIAKCTGGRARHRGTPGSRS